MFSVESDLSTQFRNRLLDVGMAGIIAFNGVPPQPVESYTHEQIEQSYGISLASPYDEQVSEKIRNAVFFLDGKRCSLGKTEILSITVPEIYQIKKELAKLPGKLYAPINGIPLTIAVANFNTESGCKCGGLSLPDSGIVAFAKESIVPGEDNSSIVVHELTHRYDDLTKRYLHARVKDILGNMDYLKSEAFLPAKRRVGSPTQWVVPVSVAHTGLTSEQRGAIATFGSFAKGQSDDEGIAGLSQMYIQGYKSFMINAGQLLDWGGLKKGAREGDFPNDREELARMFPKARQLYDLYKTEVFDGMEFNAPQGMIFYGYAKKGVVVYGPPDPRR